MAIIIGAGEPADRDFLPLATRARKRIPNEQRRAWAPESLDASIRIWREARPHAVLRSRGSAIYNCLGLVFACRRTCIDPEYAEEILQGDGMRRLGPQEDPQIGDVVMYRGDNGKVTHVGFVAQFDLLGTARVLKILSKWGAEGEYLHPVDHVPDPYGRPSEFWTDRHE